MKNKIIVFLIPAFIIVLTFYQCRKDKETTLSVQMDTLLLTQLEKDSILKGDTNKTMRILTVFNLKDSLVLRSKSHDVKADPSDSVLFRLARRMYYTLKATKTGVGLAGPQVGILRNIIWVKRLDKKGSPYECYLNAKISLYSDIAVIFKGDGCLSIPGRYGNSNRYSSVTIDYDQLDGSHNQETVEGYSSSNFTAIIFQHEIDHLYGILYIDRLATKSILLQPAETSGEGNFLM